MSVDAARISAPAFRIREDELPPELILSIERILDLHANPDTDPLDKLTNDFNPIGVLNDYFPDGALQMDYRGAGILNRARSTEAALGQLEAVQAKLAQNERELQDEIDALREELRKDQDPSRMQLIQEMISVSTRAVAHIHRGGGSRQTSVPHARYPGPARADVAYSRESDRVRSRRA